MINFLIYESFFPRQDHLILEFNFQYLIIYA